MSQFGYDHQGYPRKAPPAPRPVFGYSPSGHGMIGHYEGGKFVGDREATQEDRTALTQGQISFDPLTDREYGTGRAWREHVAAGGD